MSRQMVTLAVAILKDHEPHVIEDRLSDQDDLLYAIAMALTSIADNYDRWVNG